MISISGSWQRALVGRPKIYWKRNSASDDTTTTTTNFTGNSTREKEQKKIKEMRDSIRA